MLVSFRISQVIHTCTGCQAPVSRNKPFLKSSQDLMSVTARNLDSSFYFINCILQRLPYFILPYWPRSLPQSYPQPQLHYRCKNFGNVASLKANIFLGNYEGWEDGRRCSEKKKIHLGKNSSIIVNITLNILSLFILRQSISHERLPFFPPPTFPYQTQGKKNPSNINFFCMHFHDFFPRPWSF